MTSEKAVLRRGRGAAEETFGAPAQRVGGAWEREPRARHPSCRFSLVLPHQRDESPDDPPLRKRDDLLSGAPDNCAQQGVFQFIKLKLLVRRHDARASHHSVLETIRHAE